MKTPQFEKFNSGICGIYIMNDRNKLSLVKDSIPYHNRTIGVTRYYAAQTSKVKIGKLIRITKPLKELLVDCYISLDGQFYEIQQAQDIEDTLPKCLDLTLIKTKQRLEVDI